MNSLFAYHEISWVANEFVAATEGGGLVNERFEPTTGMGDQYHITVRLFEQDMAEFLKTDIGSLFNRNDA